MGEHDFLCLLEELFELDQGTISADTQIQEIPGWDSLALLLLVSTADQEFGVTLTADAIFGCATVNDLIGLLGDRIERDRKAA